MAGLHWPHTHTHALMFTMGDPHVCGVLCSGLELVPTKTEALDFISFEQMQRDLGF